MNATLPMSHLPPRGPRVPCMRTPGVSYGREHGFVLVMSLVFLLLLTILGATSMNTSSLQEKMAGNLRDQDMALQAADSALRGGEGQVVTLSSGGKPTASCPASNYIWTSSCISTANRFDKNWWNTNGLDYGGSGKQLLSLNDPRYVLEELEFTPDSLVLPPTGPKTGNQYYRITSRGTGLTDLSQSILQSNYRRRYN